MKRLGVIIGIVVCGAVGGCFAFSVLLTGSLPANEIKSDVLSFSYSKRI